MRQAMGTLEGATALALTPTLARKLKSWDSLLTQLPVGLCICDTNGTLMHYNRRAAAIWGRAPEVGNPLIRFCGALRVYSLDGNVLALEVTPMGQLLSTGQAIVDREVVVERPDGSRATILANLEPLHDENGALIGGVNCFQDISEHKRTQKRLRNGARVLNDFLQALPAAVYTTDLEGRITFFNHAAADLWGKKPVIGSDQWSGAWRLFWPDGREMRHDESPMATALSEQRALRAAEALVERIDGTRVPIISFPTPLHDAKGRMIGAVNMVFDITERKRADVQQKALIDELNHRVKNTLSTVQSLAAHTLRNTDSELHAAFEGRLLALSRIHDQLSRERWEFADLHAVLVDGVAPYAEEGQRLRVSGASVRLKPKTALTLALVFHELATNAYRYGALSVPDGIIDVRWQLEEQDGRCALAFSWTESGGPEVPGEPGKKGFGIRLVERSLARELGGDAQMQFAPTGLRARLRIPLGEKTAPG